MENNRHQKSERMITLFLEGCKIRNLKLTAKAGLVIAGNVLLVLIVLILAAGLKQRSVSFKSAYETLSIVEKIKKQHIGDEMTRLKNQLQLFASDSRTLGAFGSLDQAFNDIESDNYYTGGVNTLDAAKQKLENYYIIQVIPLVEEKSSRSATPADFITDDHRQIILQYLYLASNTKAIDQKQEITGAGDGSLYSGTHVQHQSWLLTYARHNRISDICFIDAKSGYVFYSIKKYPDFATNLFTGIYKSTYLAEAFRSAISAKQGTVIFTDMDHRIPGVFPPCFYLSTPVVQGNQVIGAIVFSIETDNLDRLLKANTLPESDRKAGISAFITGADMKLRCNDPDFLSNRVRYVKRLGRSGVPAENALNIEKSGCTAMNLEVSGDIFTDAALGMGGEGKYTTPSKKIALCSYTPLNIQGLNWILITQVLQAEVLSPVHSFLWLLLFTGLVLLIYILFIIIRFNGKLSMRIEQVNGSLISIAKMNRESLISDTSDEIDLAVAAAGNLKNRMDEMVHFTSQLSEGKLETQYAIMDEHDAIGISLDKLRNSMIKAREEEESRKVEDEIRNWTAQGIAMFNDILRQDNNDLKKLSFNIIRNLIQYLKANQGGFFLLEGDPSEEQYLNLISAYAYDRQKFLHKRISVGEGLAGNCVQEKQTIYLKEIPNNYIEIRSGLGGAVPRSLLIVPLKKEDQITGVIEIASFNELSKHEIEFVEKIGESIAATMVTVKLHEQTTALLEESKKRSEEISQQEEELRQNLEELKATQEEMARIRKDEEEKEKERRENEQIMMDQLKDQQLLLSKEKSLLDALLNNVNESIYFKDLQSRFIRFSSSMLKLFRLEKAEELIGKSDFDYFDDEHARPAFEDEQKIIRTGEAMVDKIEKEVLPDGRINYVNTSKMPLRDENNNVIGTFGISKDVTNFVNMQHEIDKNKAIMKKKDEEIKQLQEEIRELKKSLKK